jgi:signal transduction histidine kinase
VRPGGEDGDVTTAASTPAAVSVGPPRLYRRAQRRIIGGVAGGIADHLGVSAAAVRLVFALLTVAGGIGIPLYGVFWIVLPTPEGQAGSSRIPAWLGYVIGTIVAVGAIFGLARTMPLGNLFIPSVFAVFGAALIWRQASETQRARWWRLSRSSLSADADVRTGRIRLLAGVGLVVVGAVAVLLHTSLSAARDALVAVVVTVVGLALITGPWWMRMVTELGAERRERIRSQERAEIAAHLHDSVLQTLALIQRNSASPREVARLARGQERELRTLLYDMRTPTGQLADGLKTAAGEVEDDYAITVDVVVVGDAPMDANLAAVVAASREALVNAAKHAGVDSVSLYAEAEDDAVEVFVRDRGTGFDLDDIADDRQGIRGSIMGRVERHGGQVTVRTAAGSGTEVEIRMAR